jgi:type I restriction enzyme S subunit
MSEQLPDGWAQAALGDIAKWGSGGTPSRINPSYYGGGIPWVKTGDLGPKKLSVASEFITAEGLQNSSAKIFPKGSVAIAMYGATIGKTSILDIDASTNQACAVAIPLQGIDRVFTYYLLNNEKENFIKKGKGGAQPNISQEILKAHLIQLPPLNEQIRIADKLDSVLAKVDAAQARLEKIPTLLKRFRQSVLAAATSGELTREWRETNGIHLDQWSWKKLSDIAEIQGGVTKDSKKQSDVDEEIPYLRVANVQRGYLDLTEIKTIRIPSSKLEKLLLESGDVLFNEGGDLDKLGRGWIWENQITRCSFQNHVFRARLYDSTNNPKYVSWWGNTEGHEYFIRQGKQTTNLASINKTILSNLPINMPPTEEQKEIVRRVESLFTLADTVEKQYLAAKQRLDRLTQSLLAKAFRGELVPQDPNDEPAAELLKRIQAERNAQPPVKNKRKQQA